MEALDDERTVQLQVEVLKSLWNRMLELFRRRGWSEEEGLRMVLAAGLASLEADDRLKDTSLSNDAEGLVRELARLDSEYSAMKYMAFKLAEANKALQIKISGLKASEEAWQRWAEKVRAELSRLRGKDRDP